MIDLTLGHADVVRFVASAALGLVALAGAARLVDLVIEWLQDAIDPAGANRRYWERMYRYRSSLRRQEAKEARAKGLVYYRSERVWRLPTQEETIIREHAKTMNREGLVLDKVTGQWLTRDSAPGRQVLDRSRLVAEYRAANGRDPGFADLSGFLTEQEVTEGYFIGPGGEVTK